MTKLTADKRGAAPVEHLDTLEQLYAILPDYHYEPLWTIIGALTREPTTRMVPYLWRYADVRRLLLAAGDMISAEEADRRVLAMKNPGTAEHEVARATDTLWAAMQMVLPGEVAPPHRHSPAALRLIVEGSGGYTSVDGTRVAMHTGDFVITPSWTWHEHGHEGQDGPMLWLDGLDLPMVQSLHAVFAEFGAVGSDDFVGDVVTGGSAAQNPVLRPAWLGGAAPRTLVWAIKDVEGTFAEWRDQDGSPFDDLVLEYQDPRTNGPVMPTMSAAMQLLRAGVETKPHRHTHSVVYHVVRGEGSSRLGDEEFHWQTGDTFALPTWLEHSHANAGSADALLFSFTDRPALESLGLAREQPI